MEDLFTGSVLIGLLASAIRLATPYLYAAIGETFGQRSGVLNLGVDGIMLMGAFSAFYVVFKTGDLVGGVLLAALVGLLMGLLMAFISVTLNAEQGISGIGVYLFGLGMSDLLFQKLINNVQTVSGFPVAPIPFLSEIPVFGPILFRQNVLVYGAYILVPICLVCSEQNHFRTQDQSCWRKS